MFKLIAFIPGPQLFAELNVQYKGIREVRAMQAAEAIVYLVVVLLLAGCAGGEEDSQVTSRDDDALERRSSKTACKRAWDEADGVSDFQDTAETYRKTFTDCKDVGVASGERRTRQSAGQQPSSD